MVEGAPLLREYGFIAHRGFESLPLRQLFKLPFHIYAIFEVRVTFSDNLVYAFAQRVSILHVPSTVLGEKIWWAL